ncbi:hypothetical protein CY34DRAFT_809907 [Suillus luteus UH-Slu-Lm8-n1]|uniref:F-box domain-containing protein n=1 Tax=Suillus luteus UH-Slu-Lm8-n1 TaxID=930992 RepID=A0A0D0AIE2_9AGAM|nr:hypothetical protein CY34DRAFT_809907 [Suillus luteus UH-Slu-Lm8-n1]
MMHTDENSAALAESARVLRSRSNSQVPISRLPDEILLIIFKYFEENTRLSVFDFNFDDDDDDEEDDDGGAPACLAVTHVSRHWRQVALERPTLWRFVGSTSILWLDIMLERSQETPLVVKCRTGTSDSILVKTLEKILLHLPRIKHLEFHAISHNSDRIMELLSSQPAPMLETLKIGFSGMLPTTESTTNTIFQGEAPLLRSLQVFNWGRRWPSCTFEGIRTLQVERMQLSDLLTALQCMPSLEQLTFMGGMLQSNQPIPINSKVTLARLKNITLDENWSQDAQAVSLFRHLALPVDVNILIRHLSSEGLQPIADLLSGMDKHSCGSTPVFRSMRAIQSPPWSIGYSVEFSTSTTFTRKDDSVRLTIDFNCYGYVGDEPGATRADPQDIVFEMCNIIAERRRQTFFAGQFESIYLHGNPGFIRGLTDALRIVEGSPKVPYPSLRVLLLRDISFEGDELQDLVDVLRMRVQKDVSVQELSLRRCTNLSADQVDLCREVVEVVSGF